jgi:inner membrane protein
MDSLTQAALGGVIAQVGFHKSLGKKAIAWGIALGTLPDLDVFAAKLSSNPLAMEIIHRGLTHSVFFCAIFAMIFGIIQFAIHNGKYYKHHYARLDDKERFIKWVSLSFWVLITHPLLDLFTSYGTQLLAPISDHRFALNAISIIDPFYTLLLIISLVIGLLDIRKSTSVACIALFLSSAYLLQGLVEQHKALKIARDYSTSKQLPTTRIEALPTMMTIFGRRLWVETPTAVYIGHVSTWNNKPATWVYLDKEKLSEKDNAILQSQDKAVQEALKTYDWFTDGIAITVTHKDFGVCKLDGRYGIAPLPHLDIPAVPLGLFNLCIKDNQIRRNAPYWDSLTSKNLTIMKRLNYFVELLKSTFQK